VTVMAGAIFRPNRHLVDGPGVFSSFKKAATENRIGQVRLIRAEEYAMRSMRMIATATLITSSAFGVLGSAPAAQAKTPQDIELNGTYKATSIGGWGKINQQYHTEPELVATWTVKTTCTTMQDCTGTVKSDQGWTAPISMHDGSVWYVRHDVPNWEKCQDGTAFTGEQTFWFYPIDEATGYPKYGAPLLTGKDKTIGPSGACGQNKWLEIEIPFRLDKVS
jgi:hypothetical protein